MDTKFCTKCGQNLYSTDKFCPSCGWKTKAIDTQLTEKQKNSVQNYNMPTTTDEKVVIKTVVYDMSSCSKEGHGIGVVLIMIILAILGFILLQQLKGGMLPLPKYITDIF